ncbi:hypothetical protein [Erythrobacter rubeus]|uniref:DUF3618 domain-containing protein n=1 Tax=Erythrobacter rubeus TaxID=2760803 RepID=A0ABR8KMT4_9SPHN|nr:hypothetical protein [Erythrobacter rubeus]MBD2841913.1 hypothetical protein [Erythrobacter rubeus]
MKDLDQNFYEDRALRDAAREVFLADLAHVRASLSGTGIAGRMVDRVGEGAKDVFQTAKENADDNPGIIAALIGAILLWISRGTIFEMLGLTNSDDHEVDEIASSDGTTPSTEHTDASTDEHDTQIEMPGEPDD